MSNVVNIREARKQRESTKTIPPIGIDVVIQSITDWAEDNGIDIYNDMAFQLRLADFMALMKISAQKERKTA